MAIHHARAVGAAIFLLLSGVSGTASAAILEVGATKAYTTLAAAASAARAGDTIHVFAGTYTLGAVFTADDLTIRLAPAQAVNSARISGVVNSKGIFNIKGSRNTVIGLRFNNARVTDGNGAGIRLDGGDLTVRDCYFSGNEMGILSTPALGREGYLTVETSTFNSTESKATGHIGHSIYTGDSRTLALTVSNSKFYRTNVGHYIKSRSPATIITGNLIDDSSGKASYLIELPQGGAATISGNTLTKGAQPSNCCIAISYGTEMYKGASFQNAGGAVSIANNRFTNKAPYSVYFVNNVSTPVNPVALTANTLIATGGPIVALRGEGTVSAGGAIVASDEGAIGDPYRAGGDDSYSTADEPAYQDGGTS